MLTAERLEYEMTAGPSSCAAAGESIGTFINLARYPIDNSNGPARHTERGYGSIIKLEIIGDKLKVAGK